VSESGWSRYGTFEGPSGANKALRFLLWALQYVVHTFFLTYAGSAFVQIGDLVINGRSVSMWERIHTIYGKIYYAGHVVAALAFVASFSLAAPRKAVKKSD
jgi:hypothetical protein